MRIVLTIARKEIRDALRNRWLLLYTAAFAVLALSLSWMSLAGSGSYGFAGFGRTAAGLVN
ncbi:MAG TPA: ABC transporter permease, partial [bacterium]|nr:ABC transporter permease [bacterium]